MAIYDKIGKHYSAQRRADPRIAEVLWRHLEGKEHVLNIGAGTGSYEPPDKTLVALEPSATMISQRPAGSAPVVQGIAAGLPFAAGSFDASMAVLSMHHWPDWRRGVAEALRVGSRRFVTLTWTRFPEGFWLLDYFPEIEELDRGLFPPLETIDAEFGVVSVDVVPIPADCIDGFLCANWARPGAYLDPVVRGGISTFHKLGDLEERISGLAADLESGRWDARYGHLRDLETFDYGYRVVSIGE